jgi:head-tail adaptor
LPDNPSGQLTASTGIGALRWKVTLYRRDQVPADDLALQETLVRVASVSADIQPTFPSTFYQSTQVDQPVTHLITIRWQDYPPTIDVVTRVTERANDGSLRGELYRVRRTMELAGRKRFLRMECELEHSRTLPDDADGTLNAMLTEPYDGAAAAPPGILPIQGGDNVL